jgi:hypothetical protein
MEELKKENISYWLNWMGPINKDWCNVHGSHWCGGRIDIDGIIDEPYGVSYSVPVMHEEDWAGFSKFLMDISKDCTELYTSEELFEMYEELHGDIRWWKPE